MASTILLITESFPTAESFDAVANAWAAQSKPAACSARKVYTAIDESSCLELIALDNIAQVAELENHFQQSWSLTGLSLQADFQRQLLRFVEAPKDVDGAIPATPYIQLRHVEVRPPVYPDYLSWRERTIFNVVRNADEVEAFLAYHSVVSSEPGVMFVSGFSCPVEQYTSVFNSDHYKDIVAQAGNQYITGGERGLYTKIYHAV
ncbi:MAG: hypothetical protein H7Z39_12370 [Burkholderiaceae bacterium]|nr:hypothetical protein [Burkholderiaceae bacterium]